MKGLMFTLGAAAMAMGASYAQSALLDELTGGDVGFQYDGTALPQSSTPAFSAFHNAPPDISESVSGGILTLNSPYGKDRLYRMSPGANWSPDADGTTVEVKMKIDSVSDGASGAGDIGVITETRTWKWQFRSMGITDHGPGGGTLLYGDLPGGLDPTAFHTFRFVITGQDGPASLYIDGSTTAAYTWAGGAHVTPANNRLDWGDDLGASGGQTQWDYIQWTNDGAYAPVPEPTVLSLAAFGAAALLRRSRR